MKFTEPRAYTAPEKAARRLVEIASHRQARMHAPAAALARRAGV